MYVSEETINDIRDRLLNLGETPEIEIRYGVFRQYFLPGVHKNVWMHLNSLISGGKIETTKDHFSTTQKGVRIKYTKKEESIYKITKSNTRNYDNKKYSYRISSSKETVEEVKTIPENLNGLRKKTRYIYEEKYAELHMTIVTTEIKGRHKRVTYEIEIELDSNLFSADNRVKIVNDLYSKYFSLLYQTDFVYSVEEKGDVHEMLNRELGSCTAIRDRMDITNIPKPRNIKHFDLFDLKEGYLTIKVDGFNRFLVFAGNGVYFVSAYYFNKVSEEKTGTAMGTIFQGEQVPTDRLQTHSLKMGKISDKSILNKGKEHIFIPFDIINLNGKNLIHKTYKDRIRSLMKMKDKTMYGVHLFPKVFEHYSSTTGLYVAVKSLSDKKYQYSVDGLILNPNVKYRDAIHGGGCASEILKWKPVRELTIDFTVRTDSTGTRKLYSAGNIEFKGTEIYPFNARKDLLILPGYKLSGVIEFAWNGKKLYPKIDRPDKTSPNLIWVANDVWRDIHDPITLSTMTGDGMFLIKKYHAQIKKRMYAKAIELLGEREELRLISIGSGKGADLQRWENIGVTHAFIVEPDEKQIEEFKKRAENTSIKITLMKTKGQASNIIEQAEKYLPGSGADIIEYMQSLSFFYPYSERYRRLIDAKKEAKLTGKLLRKRYSDKFKKKTREKLEEIEERIDEIKEIDETIDEMDYETIINLVNSLLDSKGVFLSLNIDGGKILQYLGTHPGHNKPVVVISTGDHFASMSKWNRIGVNNFILIVDEDVKVFKDRNRRNMKSNMRCIRLKHEYAEKILDTELQSITKKAPKTIFDLLKNIEKDNNVFVSEYFDGKHSYEYYSDDPLDQEGEIVINRKIDFRNLERKMMVKTSIDHNVSVVDIEIPGLITQQEYLTDMERLMKMLESVGMELIETGDTTYEPLGFDESLFSNFFTYDISQKKIKY
uniref:mRNA 5'-phosphatase n=1 Tax=Pithovirus LCDPAC01 TaxID=2506600 RepID=A0A481YMX3_9VIRU|nr:MAG: mRNA capping enzyme [Pithovirus LCDPAC01]